MHLGLSRHLHRCWFYSERVLITGYHLHSKFQAHRRLNLDVMSLLERPFNMAGMLFTTLKRPCVFFLKGPHHLIRKEMCHEMKVMTQCCWM